MHAESYSKQEWSITTRRLTIRPAMPTDTDIDFLLRLWTNHKVMRFVGYPQGLRTDQEQIKEQLGKYGPSEYDRVLLVQLLETGAIIGECKLGSTKSDGIAETDVKLLPEHWGNGYGREIKLALVEYLFTHTECRGVRATPNKANTASIRMQEAVGAEPVGEGVYRFPDHLKAFTVDVFFIEYIVWRENWKNRR